MSDLLIPTFLAVFLLSWTLDRRAAAPYVRRAPEARPDRFQAVVSLAYFLILFSSVFEYVHMNETIPRRGPTALAGLSLILGARLIRAASITTLGRSFTSDLAVQGGLVTHGLYAKIRHPCYLGVILVGSGMALTFSSVLGLGLCLLILLPETLARIGREERLLREKFSEYRSYQSRTWRLVPYLF